MIEKIETHNSFWSQFYQNDLAPKNPSSFAELCLTHLDQKKPLLELGCGNGRDSFFFARNKIETVAVDLCEIAIGNNKKFNVPNVSFRKMDFTQISDDEIKEDLGGIYSRFTLHSVDKEGYQNAIKYCGRKLNPGGKLFIEARTINDPLYGKGIECPDDGYIDTHYRRFLTMRTTMEDVMNEGFELDYAIEDYLSSWYRTDHAVVLRIIGKKK